MRPAKRAPSVADGVEARAPGLDEDVKLLAHFALQDLLVRRARREGHQVILKRRDESARLPRNDAFR